MHEEDRADWDRFALRLPLDGPDAEAYRNAQRLILHRSLCVQACDVAQFHVAGMPEWLAEAAFAEMKKELAVSDSTKADEIRRRWLKFAGSYIEAGDRLYIPR